MVACWVTFRHVYQLFTIVSAVDLDRGLDCPGIVRIRHVKRRNVLNTCGNWVWLIHDGKSKVFENDLSVEFLSRPSIGLSLSVSLGSIGMGNWWSKVTASSVDVSGNNNQALSMNDAQNHRSTEVGVDQRITTTSFDLVSTGILIIAVSHSLVHRVLSPPLNIHRSRVAVIVLNRRTVSFKSSTSVIVGDCLSFALSRLMPGYLFVLLEERVPESIHTIGLFSSKCRSPMNGR